jgi:hypothetical protein
MLSWKAAALLSPIPPPVGGIAQLPVYRHIFLVFYNRDDYEVIALICKKKKNLQ